MDPGGRPWGRGEQGEKPIGGRDMAKDPVCGMMVDEKRAAATAVYQGTTYYFCAQACKRAFEQTPEKYTAKR
jgi:YHS domain-containing protein